MKQPTQKHSFAVMLAAVLAALAAFITTSQAQVTFQQMTNGLVDYYPLQGLAPGSTNITPDLVSRRDMLMNHMDSTYFVAGSHPGIDGANVINFSQSPLPTVITYQSAGQNPLDGSGDFLPFINQRGATMNFWIKGPLPSAADLRVMAECADNGDSGSFFSLSAQPASKLGLGYFLRENGQTTDTNGATVNAMPDGTLETPSFFYVWSQSTQYTTNTIFDNNWHMMTTVISTNGDVHCFIDGNYDAGASTNLDHENNVAITPPIDVTNTYYNTNIYPFGPMTTNGGPGLPYVHWMIPGLAAPPPGITPGAFTAFGGFDRNGGISAGAVCQMSDVGFWNRALTTNEIWWLTTNGLATGLTINTNIINATFYGDFSEVGTKHNLNLHWNVTGASSSPGGVVISPVVGDVSSSPNSSTSLLLGNNASYTFTLTAHNGVVADKQLNVTITTLNGVPSSWNLVQRFDTFANTTQGVSGNGWQSISSFYNGVLDRFNVVTVNGNKVLSPKSGYLLDSGSPFGYDTRGALSYGVLNGLTIPPGQSNTLFFRFSLRDPASLAASNSIYSGMDFAVGLSDYNFSTGPLTIGTNATDVPGSEGTFGPAVRIVRWDPSQAYLPTPFDLQAQDYSGTSVTNSYSYVTNVTASGLSTNVNYMVWMDIQNLNTTAGAINGSPTNNATLNEPVFSVWMQKQGDLSRTLLFSGFHGDRDYINFNPAVDTPTPNLNKVFVSMGNETFINPPQNGAFFETNNMLLIDDFYMSTNGYNGTIPRLFNISAVVRGATNASVTWESLGSLFQANTYSVQRKLTLKDPSWVTLTNGLPSGGDFTTYIDTTVGSSPTAFYRISWP